MIHPVALTAVIYFAGIGAAGQFSKLAIGFAALAEHYDASAVALGFTVSLISALGVVLGMAAGMLVARIGYVRALRMACVLGAALSIWQAGMPELELFMASRVLEGLAHLMIVVAAPTLLAERISASARGAALTVWSTFFGVAFGLTAALGAPLISAFGLSALLGAHGVWMAVAGLLCWWLLPADGAAPVMPKLTFSDLFARHVKAYQTPGILTPTLSWLCYTLTFVSMLTALPLLVPASEAVWLAGVAPMLAIAVSLTLGITLLRMTNGLFVLRVGFAASLGAAALAAFTGFGAVGFLSLFFAMAFVQGAGFAVVPELNESSEDRAIANGGLAQLGNLGNLTGTPLLIWMFGIGGTWGVFALLAAAYSVGIMVAVFVGARAKAV